LQFNSGALVFGDFSSSPTGANFVGRIDDVRIYSAARTAKAIRDDIADGVNIVQQPSNQGATLGGNSTFSVSARGYLTPLAYQWQFNGTNIAGATNSAVTISNVQPSQLGDYRVQVKGGGAAGLTTNVSSKLTGSAFQMGGYNIDIPNNGSFDLQKFTYLMWVRSPAPGTFKYLFSRARSAPGPNMTSVALYTGTPAGVQGIISLQQTNIFGDLIATNQYVTPIIPGITTNLWDGGWHQVGLVWDGTTLMTYFDGAPGSSVNTAVAFQPGSVQYSDGTGYQNADLVLGGLVLDDVTITKYGGDLDEVKVFNRDLTPTEITNNFNNPSSNPSDLVGWWTGDDVKINDLAGLNDQGYAVPEIGASGYEVSQIATLSAIIPALFTKTSVDNGIFQSTLTGPTGQNFSIERSGGLTSPTWTPLITNVVPFIFNDPVGTNSSFYRAKAQ
jgi:hypothetical protein